MLQTDELKHFPIFREVTIAEKKDLHIRVAPVKNIEYDTYVSIPTSKFFFLS